MSKKSPIVTTRSPLGIKQTVATIGIVAVSVAAIFGGFLFFITVMPSLKSLGVVSLIGSLLVVINLAVFAVLIGLFRHWNISLADIGFHAPTKRLWHLLWQIPIVLTAAVLMQVVVTAISNSMPKNDAVTDVALHANIPWTIIFLLTICILTPIWEEVVFRGVIYGELRRKFHVPLAALSAAIIFALAHVAPEIMPYIAVLGFGLALIYEFHRTLIASIITHATVNTLASVAIIQALLT